MRSKPKPRKQSGSQKPRTKPQEARAVGFGAALRKVLLRIEPAGDCGFEGLLAETLAAFSGLTFRLAKSGSQFGRDGSSTSAPFAIALEAKRYDSDLRLEDLAGKVVVAGSELGGRIDVWALGATSNVGDGHSRETDRHSRAAWHRSSSSDRGCPPTAAYGSPPIGDEELDYSLVPPSPSESRQR